MRDFSWKYFAMTGDLDAYLLYRDTAPAGFETAEDAAEDWDDAEEEA